jgi:hypothetical protein
MRSEEQRRMEELPQMRREIRSRPGKFWLTIEPPQAAATLSLHRQVLQSTHAASLDHLVGA